MGFVKCFYNDFIYLTAPDINITHAFSAKYGQPCGGKFSEESMTILCSALNISPDKIFYNNQVHGNTVRIITQESIPDSSFLTPNPIMEADALITNVKGAALMVFTADCVPVLLSDPVKGVIGAVHAGWRGTALNISAAAVHKMVSVHGCSPADIRAAIGPCISKCCYETDADVADALRRVLHDEAELCISPAPGGKYMTDLKEANRIMLRNAGVQNISSYPGCTACSKDDTGYKYWSHRRQGLNRGSQCAVIMSN